MSQLASSISHQSQDYQANQQAIEKVVKDYAQKEGYTLVLNDRVLVYGGEEMNITDKIVKLLNESYPKNPPK